MISGWRFRQPLYMALYFFLYVMYGITGRQRGNADGQLVHQQAGQSALASHLACSGKLRFVCSVRQTSPSWQSALFILVSRPSHLSRLSDSAWQAAKTGCIPTTRMALFILTMSQLLMAFFILAEIFHLLFIVRFTVIWSCITGAAV